MDPFIVHTVDPRSYIRLPTPRVPLVNKLAVFGSSTSAFGPGSNFTDFANGVPGRALADVIKDGLEPAPASTATLGNYAAGGATRSSHEASADQAVLDGYGNACFILQSEGQNNQYAVQGGGHIAAKWFKNTFRPKFNAAVTAEKRFLAWVGTYGNEWAYGSNTWVNNVQYVQKLWDDFPGQVLSGIRYVQFMPRDGSEQDAADHVTGIIPKSLQIPDRSHGNNQARRLAPKYFLIHAVEAWNGGLPFFPDHYYFVQAATAQTNGGAVCTLGFMGSLAGCTLSLKNADGSPSIDFAIDSATAAVTRASGTLLMKPVDLFLEVRRGDQFRAYHLEIGIADLTTTPKLSYLDGNVGTIVWSNDNAGTEEAPNYPVGSTRVWAGLGGGLTEGTFVFLLHPAAPENGGAEPTMYLQYHQNGPQIQRMSSGAVRVSMRDEAGNSFGQQTSGITEATGRVTNADGRRWVIFTFSCPNDRQRLMVVDDATGVVKYNSGAVSLTARANGALNPVPNVATAQMLFLSGFNNAYSNVYRGLHGPRWLAAKEIDMTVAGNMALFRAGAGVLADLGASGAVTPVSGPNAGVAITPYDYWNGHAAELVAGWNRGTGGRHACWQRRQLFGGIRDWARGVPVTQ
jgi:hypothetical protein